MGDPRPYDDRPSKLRSGFVPPLDRFSTSNSFDAAHRGSSESGTFGGSDSNFHPEELDGEDRPYKGERTRSGGSGAGGMSVAEQPYSQNQPELSILLREHREYQSGGGLLSFTDWLENDDVEKHYQPVTPSKDRESRSCLKEDDDLNQVSVEPNRDLRNGILGAWKLPQEKWSSDLNDGKELIFDNEKIKNLVKGPEDVDRLLGFCHAIVGKVEQFGVGVRDDGAITEFTAITPVGSFTVESGELREMFGFYPKSAPGGDVTGISKNSSHSDTITGESTPEAIGMFFLRLEIKGIRPDRTDHFPRRTIFYKYVTNPEPPKSKE